MFEWLVLLALVGAFAVVLAALRLDGTSGDQWDLMSAHQRAALMKERHDANPDLRRLS
jgi:cytochrome b561